MPQSIIISVRELSGAGEGKRQAARLADTLGWTLEDAGGLAIAVTEAATNLLRHAGGGEIHLRECGASYGDGIEMIALDSGPGMSDIDRCLSDGFSTIGTQGQGLGAIARLATEFDIHSTPGRGTVLVARFYRSGVALPALRVGSIQSPVAGEELCGDSWCAQFDENGATFLLADGLGHGMGAATASRKAVEVVSRSSEVRPIVLLEIVHRALRGTRGAAVAIARIDLAAGLLSFAGIGNITGILTNGPNTQHLISPSGTAGDTVRKMNEYTYPWPAHGRLLMHSDGLTTSWKLGEYAGLEARDPALLAALLFRDARRERDDACVVVAQGAR